jgi:hypothetical protein
MNPACPGCGLEDAPHPGPTHAYIGASPACWARYGELLAREYGELNLPAGHRLTVDAYAVQHPGHPERRAIQSVAVHLIALHLVHDRGEPPAHVTARLGRIIARLPRLHWLEPPSPNGTLTVLHPLAAGPADHHEHVLEWAADVWRAWTPHHATVQRWLTEALGESGS